MVEMLLAFEFSRPKLGASWRCNAILTFPRSQRRPFLNPDASKWISTSKKKQRQRPVHSTFPKRFHQTTFAEYARCPFNPEDYKRVRVHLVKTHPSVPTPQGTLLLVEDKYDISDGELDGRGLLVHVGGDTLTAIMFAASEKEPERPMTLHLLHNILEYHRELQPLEWHLLHVAIVDLRNDIFIGRLFFGNPETGEIRWDCDCRPSDACWISMKRMCPIYVRNAVWESCAMPLESMFSNQVDVRSTLEKIQSQTDPAFVPSDTSDPFTTIRSEDPIAIKRLKREMTVAVKEEDYSAAARIRDHPYMRKYKAFTDLKKEGKLEQASQIYQELRELIEHDNKSEKDDV